MANQVVSLAYYVHRARKAGATCEELSVVDENYYDILTRHADLAKASALWAEMYDANDPLIPLSEIDIAQTDYLDIVAQIFNGVHFRDVSLSGKRKAPPPPTHESYFKRYLATIPTDTRTCPAVTASIDRVNEVLETHGAATFRANGLIVGRVQSGKTRNYIGLMLKAIDEGWNVILVLTSCNTFLAKQTRDRIVREFEKVGAANPKFSRELNFMSSGHGNVLAGEELKGDFFYWGVSMKEVHGLESVRKWLDIQNQPIGSMRVLIVDDESDNATPDSNAGGQGLLDDEAISERIDGIRHDASFAGLADWFESLLERKWPELGENTREGQVFGEIYDILAGNKSAKDKMMSLVNGGDYRHLLGMENFADPSVESLIPAFFSHQGHGEDAYGGFVLLLRSILDIVRGRSAINAALCTLVGPNPQTGEYAYPFQRCAYLGYTATPYANILNEGPGHTPIYADFIQSLSIPPQYFGVEAIFGSDLSNAQQPRMPIVNPITDDESALILTPLQNGEDVDPDENLRCKSKQGTKDWQGLKDALAWAFCTASARRFARRSLSDSDREKVENRWTTMLVNIDHKQDVHDDVCDAITQYLKHQLSTPELRSAFVENCRQLWLRETKRFTPEQFDQIFNRDRDEAERYGAFAAYPNWDDIAGNLECFLSDFAHRVHVVVMNCTNPGTDAKRLYNQDPYEIAQHEVMELTGDHLWIVSGGNTISRGLTLSGLTSSYFERLREGTCVDTITQMGRWFGYRQGYELLPRIWMNGQTVAEMKKIAALEQKLHATIADNFAQHFSPSDPAHYQQVTSWGRQLSGRAFAQRDLDAAVGTIGSTGEFRREASVRRQIVDASRAFLDQCGEPVARDPGKYAYAATPLWEGVPREVIQKYLTGLLPLYPEKSRLLLRGLLREISASENPVWDVVIGSPRGGAGHCPSEALGPRVNCATPNSLLVGADVIRFSARLHMAFYAMIPTVFLNREDIALLTTWRHRIFSALDAKRIQNGGVLPKIYDAALPGEAKEPLRMRFDRLIDDLRKADGAIALPEPIHARLGDISQGLRNRSSGEYMSRVHGAVDHKRPTLQLLLVQPNGEKPDGIPYVSVSFYWPGHDAADFFTVAVDENPDFVSMVTRRGFCQTVQDILRAHDFPMQRNELLCEVLERLGLRCNENFFAANIAHPLAGYSYHKMTGRNAYCIDGWAADEEARLGREFAAAAIEIVRRERRKMTSEDVLNQTIAEYPKFRGFFTTKGEVTALLTQDVLDANDIERVSAKPITYLYRN